MAQAWIYTTAIQRLYNEVQGIRGYPSLYKILVDERDIHMAKQLNKISSLYPDKQIVAVVGAGHIKGILSYLFKLSDVAV